jgi:hypothetical protein
VHRNGLGFHVAAEAADILHNEVTDFAFVFLGEVKGLFKYWPRCVPRAFAFCNEDTKHRQRVDLRIATLSKCKSSQHLPVGAMTTPVRRGLTFYGFLTD